MNNINGYSMNQTACTTHCVYLLGISNDIERIVLTYKQCQDHLPSNPKEPILYKFKARPTQLFQKIAGDLYSHASPLTYMILVDCLTDWPDIVPMHGHVTPHLLTLSELSDSCSTAQQFQKCFGLMRDPSSRQSSSPVFSTMKVLACQVYTQILSEQWQGRVYTVNAMKKLIRSAWTAQRIDEDKLCHALLQYHNTLSHSDGYHQPRSCIVIQCKPPSTL